MRVITFEDRDARALLDRLTLEAMKVDPALVLAGNSGMSAGDLHRRMHHVVVRWLQDQGFQL